MSLASYQPPSREVPLGGTTLHLEGLSLEHFAILVREHLPDLDALVELFSGNNVQSTEDFQKVALAIVTQAPGFAGNVIALSPEAAEKAMRIPAPTQIEMLVAIGDLTFTEVGGIKKAMGTVAGLLQAMNVNPKALTQKVAKAKAK